MSFFCVIIYDVIFPGRKAILMTDRAALKAIKNGDENALSLLIERYAAYVGTVIFNIIGEGMSREDIEETTSDVFLTLWQNAEKPSTGKLRAWLGAVARNKAKNKLRELKSDLPLEDDYIVEASESIQKNLIENEEREITYIAINNMEQKDKEIFLRHYYAIQPVKKISQELKMTEASVKTRLSRGREKLRKLLRERGYIE